MKSCINGDDHRKSNSSGIMSKIKELLRVSDEEIRTVRCSYNKTEDGIEGDVNLLLDWLKKQPHLPKLIDRERLERCLQRNKFRIEQTKTKLDNYFSFKVFYPEFYANLDPRSPLIQKVRRSAIITPMPQLLPSSQRLIFIKIVKNEEDNFDSLAFLQYFALLWEFQLSHDYGVSDVYICDTKNITFKHVAKIDANLVCKWFVILKNGYSGRLFQVHNVHIPPSVNILMNLFQRALSAKFFGKLKLHPDFDSLHDVIPKEYLPEEAGGNMGSAEDLSDKWFEEMLLQKEFLKTKIEEASDEKLRIGKSIYGGETFGIDGTFRKINID